ncbi:MAG: hypothetical protein IJK31_10345 [Ruminococcus sp.]|nr:hypothetical protein [Ruminococcus sp.]
MIVTSDNYKGCCIGAKAERLFQMKQHGLNVPDLFCAAPETQKDKVLSYVRETFPKGTMFSVRSSATAEDGISFSFAGQLETFLFVPEDQLWDRIEQCRRSAATESIAEYLRISGISREAFRVNVIIQKMVDADCSGIIFTANPQGILSETVIVIGAGTGDNVVEDKVPVNTYYCDRSGNSFYCEQREGAPKPDSSMIAELLRYADEIRELYGCECDIEYAVKNGEIFILQARPITTLHPDGHIILDSSNISESYPGISSPMTISFVKNVYHLVFSSCVRRITHNDGTAERLDEVLSNMTDSANGRIYYRISSWYDVITMLPFSKKIIPVWQEMLGVSDKSVTRSSAAPSRMTKLRVMRSFIQLMASNERNMKKLNRKFDEIYPLFSDRIRQTDSPAGLFDIYTELKDTLAGCWDLTLVNDMYSFIFTGLLKHSLRSAGYEKPEDTANQIICGSDSIESMKPVHMLDEICRALRKDNDFEAFCNISSREKFERFIRRPTRSAVLIKRYIDNYGDRCANELKLEAETYRTDPLLLVETVSEFSYAPSGKKEVPQPKLHGLSKLYAKKAYNGILLRERSRMSRGRIFGFIREIVLKCGSSFAEQGIIDQPRDIFYLTFDELEQAVSGSTAGLRERIASRRLQWDSFAALPQYSRIVFDSRVFDKHPANYVSETLCSEDTLIYGTPCSSGVIEGEIKHISALTADTDAAGKIILADVTDPGWVFVISQSAGIISKRGSLLSHTAIISRELKKPAVVGVGTACDHLRDGDYVRLNGIDGTVQLIRRTSA